MSDVFISYARATEPMAELIDRTLTGLGFSVWRDEALPIYRSYSRVIEERLGAAKAVVVLWSREALASDWVRAEAEVARESRKLVQVSVDDTAPPIPFNQTQCGDLSGWSGDVRAAGWEKLLASLGDLVAPSVSSRSPAKRASAPPLLAVLAFDNLSADPEMLYFSDGVSEEILQTVAQTTDLKVIGRSSSFQFRGPDKSARNVARELNATHVLDGSVRRSGLHLRVVAQLIDCETQTTLWSGRFDRQLEDVFTLQDEIAAAVAQALVAAFAPSPQSGAIDPAAYDLYLRARASSPGREGLFDAGLLRQAVKRAPKFVQAWSVLAYVLANQARYADAEAVGALHAEVRRCVGEALALDPSAGLAHAALGYLCAPAGEYAAWEASLDEALKCSPRDPIVLYQCSLHRHWVGRSWEGLRFIEDAHELDPLYAQGANWRASLLDATGREAEAREAYLKARSRWPEFEFLFSNASRFACRTGDWAWVDEMAHDMENLGLDTPLVRAIARSVAARRASPDEGRALLQEVLDREIATTGSFQMSHFSLAGAIGAVDEAFHAAARASFAHLFRPGAHLPSRNISIAELFSRESAPLRRDPRFVELCGRLGLVEYWSRSDLWPDCAEDVAPDYDFKAECARLLAGGLKTDGAAAANAP